MTYHSTFPTVRFSGNRTWDEKDGTVAWASLNPSRGTYNWASLDSLLSALDGSGGHDVIFTFGRTPSWATGGKCTGYYVNAGGCAEPPANLSDWDNFVTTIVTRYKGRIKYWELWNEFNDTGTYAGTQAQMATLGQHLYQIARSIDPQAVILGPDAYGDANFLECYLRPTGQKCTSAYGLSSGATGAGGGAYADVITFHGYAGASPASVLTAILNYKKAMQNAGISNKPLWNTEGSWGNQTQISISDSQKVAYVGSVYLFHWSNSVERYYWYAFDNGDWGTLATRSTGTLQPAGIAYREIQKWMVGASMTSPCTKTSGGLWSCALSRPGGYQALAVWNESGSAAFQVPSQFKQYRELNGSLHTGVSGSVAISIAPILLETGTGF